MSSNSPTGKDQSRSDSDLARPSDEGENTRNKQTRHESRRASLSNTLTDSKETPGAGVQLRDEPSLSNSKMPTDENEEMIITSIRATDVALGLRRIPTGFYAVVRHSDLEWRTENKPNNGVVEWTGSISIPSALSATIRLEVYASFEIQPMLGAGEQLRKLTVTVEQLLERSGTDVPFTLFPKDGDIVSPCSSIMVTIKRREREMGEPSVSGVSSPIRSTTKSKSDLERLTNQGHNALSHYQKHGGKRDLEHSIEAFEQALSLCSPNHPCLAAAQSNLAMAKFILCQVNDIDLVLPLGLYRSVLSARPVGHPDRPFTLIHLAAVHSARFEKSGDEGEGARAEELLHMAVGLTSAESHEHQAAKFLLQLHRGRRAGFVRQDQSSVKKDLVSGLTDEDLRILSLQLMHRFERFGNLADLQQAITLFKELVDSISPWGDRYCARLTNLGCALLCRFERLGQSRDLEDAISVFRKAVNLTHHGHPQKPDYLYNLGRSLSLRFEFLGQVTDIEDAISRQRDANDLTPRNHPQKPSCLNLLGNTLRIRFEHLGQPRDLEDAILTLRDAVNLIPHRHPERYTCLNNLGMSLRARFALLGQLSDLENAISVLKDAVDLTPHGHPHKPHCLNNLGNSILTRFEQHGQSCDLEDAIVVFKDAVDFTPHGHSRKPGYISNLGNCFRTRFDHLGQLNDLENAISRQRDAIDLTHHGHPEKPGYLNNLGNSLRIRFARLGSLTDLQDAISRQRDAVDLTPHDHPQRPSYLNNLGSSLLNRFERLEQLNDLEDAISTFRNAVDLTPHGHPDKPGFLNSLGVAFRFRFEPLRQLSDLEDAIVSFRNAVNLAPHGHPQKPIYLNGLGTSFRIRFTRLGQLSDLEDSISRHKDAVDLTPHGHPYESSRLGNLGTAFYTRFECFGQQCDLDVAISTLKNAADLLPNDHPQKPVCSANLGNCFRARFEYLGKLGDLEDAIATHKDAVDLTPHGYPEKPGYLNNLGASFVTRFERLGRLSDLEHAIFAYSRAASAPFGPISVRFQASRAWISCARQIRHPSLLHAYSVSINLFPQLAWIGLSLTHRYSELTRGADVVREAAAVALELGFPETAVEWLEQGRSIVWGELFQLRGSYDELSSAYPEHARRLQELSAALDHASATHERSLSTLSEQTGRGTGALEEEANKHRMLAIERDSLLKEIRELPGLERFLLRKKFSELRASARAGPVVILNAAESRSDALIVLADVDHVIHVPLSNFTFQRSAGLYKTIEKLLGYARVIRCDDREGNPATRGGVGLESLLSALWKDIVKPTLSAMAFSTPGNLSRVFWCPTGHFMFLPIHAAGFYGAMHSQLGNKVFDFVVSSYAPTLSSLAPSLSPNATASSDLRLLAVRQPSSDGQAPLPGVTTELGRIMAIIRSSPSATFIESSDGTVEEVLALMKEADWVHFACHGVQDATNPTNSGLCLADGRRLKISDIIALSRPRGGLAFLSACQTAMGDKVLSDEAIHTAAGMLFAGYGGVIGTMWSISDSLAPVVAGDVYEKLFGDGKRSDYRLAARALHEAVGYARDNGASFINWVPFIHLGL